MSKKSNHLLELVMFDIAYVISNCDYEYSSDEKKYLNIILNRYDEDDRELLKLRTQFLDSILEKGIDEIYCLSVNDTFVMNAWFTAQGIEKVKALPDGSGSFTTGIGANVQKDNLGFGLRSWRYAIVVNDGVIESVFSEDGFRDDADTDPYEVSSPENVLNNL